VYVAELAIAGLAGGQPAEYRVTSPARQATVERDLAIIVAADRPAAEVEAAIRRHGGPLLRGVTLFDIYRGRPLAETDKSLAFRLLLRDDERTLTEAELDAAVAGVMDGLANDLGARFRT
jgi:phenylalanyl-tRNA synthetase beta chain